jgi:hypothetical protein
MTERTRANGKIEVQVYEPTTYEEPDEGPNLVTVHVEEIFSGDIDGKGVVTFLQVVGPDGSASFVGVERVTGTLNDKTGSFVLQDKGTVEADTVSGTWFVVPGSGTGELTGLRGEGGFTASLGEGADISLNYWFV